MGVTERIRSSILSVSNLLIEITTLQFVIYHPSWDNYKTVVGTDGDDLTFIDFTDDKTDDTAATDSYSQTTWQLKGGAGNDVIVGGFEKKFANEWMEGDSCHIWSRQQIL